MVLYLIYLPTLLSIEVYLKHIENTNTQIHLKQERNKSEGETGLRTQIDAVKIHVLAIGQSGLAQDFLAFWISLFVGGCPVAGITVNF